MIELDCMPRISISVFGQRTEDSMEEVGFEPTNP